MAKRIVVATSRLQLIDPVVGALCRLATPSVDGRLARCAYNSVVIEVKIDMSLCISVVTPEGIVMAGDSRQTQVIAGVNRIASDSAIKVFDLTNTVLAAATGWAFLQPQGATMMRTISSLVEDFKPTILPGSDVLAIATQLWTYFSAIYQQHIVSVPNQAVPAGQSALSFNVAGYDPHPGWGGFSFLIYQRLRLQQRRGEVPTILDPGGLGRLTLLQEL